MIVNMLAPGKCGWDLKFANYKLHLAGFEISLVWDKLMTVGQMEYLQQLSIGWLYIPVAPFTNMVYI